MGIITENGVHLTVKSTKKFKTIKMYVDLIAPVAVDEISLRVLLAQLLETSSEKYPTQIDLAEQLSWMYGASFGASVFRYGTQQGIRFTFNLVSGKYLGLNQAEQQQLMADVFDFLKEVIFKPLIDDSGFDGSTFDRQKANIIDYLNSMLDDKQQLAGQSLRKLYYENDEAYALGVLGDADHMAPISRTDLFAYYKKALDRDQVFITVLGDVAEEEIAPFVTKLPFKKRSVIAIDPFHHREITENREETLAQPVSQSKLNLAFSFPIYRHGDQYFEALVFNELLGASPISLLFLNVREKESLAYYASSQYSPFTGTLTVESGIEAKNMGHVRELILQQIDAIKTGDFSDELFDKVISKMLTDREVAYDNQRALMNSLVVKSVIGEGISDEEWVERIKQVTKENVMAVAAKAQLQAQFFLKGTEDAD
ncbi:Zn-dependent peptidase [Secundilactobacillus oryzae JCM 18671]|uniref:Zn-dependent peptidase n=1 Tax=Secundilactobacillus oryzae JCM 18671 TaxID=1291743 RepID=A0A081BIP8_9LACO|nr:pitrilysin family protein [Secundilactobacillus oryzae]GAK47916.1 Zn-dependent peptidase [Secundilactobacillus oryzae JCM 18671]